MPRGRTKKTAEVVPETLSAIRSTIKAAAERNAEAERKAAAECVVPPTVSEYDRAQAELEKYAADEPEGLTVGQFLALLTELLTPVATKGILDLNGVPVHDVMGVNLRCGKDGLIVDLRYE